MMVTGIGSWIAGLLSDRLGGPQDHSAGQRFDILQLHGVCADREFLCLHRHAFRRETTPAIVGAALSLLGITEMVGGFVAGWLTGRLKPALLLSGFYGLRAISGWLPMQSPR